MNENSKDINKISKHTATADSERFNLSLMQQFKTIK